MKVTVHDVDGEVLRDNETYVVTDNRHLNNLVVSTTHLHPGKETKGHKHDGLDEVYVFVEGKGKMLNGEVEFEVEADDVVLVPGGNFHKVFNTGDEDLKFLAIFQQYERND